MKLFTFAYKAEAQSFIKNDVFQKTNNLLDGLYNNEDSFLLITGEGIESTSRKLNTCFFEYKYNISFVINLGIAGALDRDLGLESVYSIRKIYLEDDNQSFTSSDSQGNIDCISAKNRVLFDKYAEKLLMIAPVVDREIWAIANVCQKFHMPFQSIKLISDYAGNNTNPDKIIKNAKKYSAKLYNHYYHSS